MISKSFSIFFALLFSHALFAKQLTQSKDKAKVVPKSIYILTTTSDLAYLTKVVSPESKVEALCPGYKDPHHIEAKPSYMKKANEADLVISVGLELEIGWLPKVISGGRNPSIVEGKNGYLDVGKSITPIEIPKGKVTREHGDVHPDGNPHYTLDPIRAGEVAQIIAKRLGILDEKSKEIYKERADKFQKDLKAKTDLWIKRVRATGIKKVVTYHTTFSYLWKRLGVEVSSVLEPVPGVAPGPRHIIDVIAQSKKDNIKIFLVANHFNPAPANTVSSKVPGSQVFSIPSAVGGAKGVDSLEDVYESIISCFEKAAKGKQS